MPSSIASWSASFLFVVIPSSSSKVMSFTVMPGTIKSWALPCSFSTVLLEVLVFSAIIKGSVMISSPTFAIPIPVISRARRVPIPFTFFRLLRLVNCGFGWANSSSSISSFDFMLAISSTCLLMVTVFLSFVRSAFCVARSIFPSFLDISCLRSTSFLSNFVTSSPRVFAMPFLCSSNPSTKPLLISPRPASMIINLVFSLFSTLWSFFKSSTFRVMSSSTAGSGISFTRLFKVIPRKTNVTKIEIHRYVAIVRSPVRLPIR